MGIITLLTFLEKILPSGEYFSKIIGIGLIVLGIWIVFDPSSVPFFGRTRYFISWYTYFE
ncbi:hypothetical protein ACT7DG_30925 [Bacillus cereus]